MTRLPSFPTFDLSAFDLSKLRAFDLPKLPTFDGSKLPAFELPTFDLPNVPFGKVDDRVVDALKNAAYLTVGLAVTAVQRVTKIAA